MSAGKGSNLREYRKMVESGRVRGKCRIRSIIENTVSEGTGKGSNLCEYRKMVESGRVHGKGRIRVSIDQLSRRVSKKCRICVSTEKWQKPNHYREKVESVRVSKN